MGISRRAVLNGMGQTATLGALAAALPAQLRAADAAAPAAAAPAAPAAPMTYCLTRIYQRSEGAIFNGDVFRNRHVANMIKAYGKDAERIELRLPVPATEGTKGSAILATVNVWFRDAQTFLGKHKAALSDLTADMELVTKVVPGEQVDQVLASLGDARAEVPADSYVYSTYFPFKEGGTIDTAYFANTFYPKFQQTYGNEAIRRIEVTKAATPKPLVVATTHVYIRDADLYDSAAKTKGPELFAELVPYTNIIPLQTLTTVHAFG